MATYAFTGAVAPVPAVGQKHKFRFAGTFTAGDTWTTFLTSTLQGDITIGKGNIAGQTYTTGFKLRNRVYVGFGSSFALSAINDPTKWEEQDTGTAVISFLSQYGDQDTVNAFASFEGRLVVFGRKSIQIWQIDADPAQFVLLQTLDNSGTRFPLTVKSVGDLDVYFLEDSGVRSIRSKSFNDNAFVSDIGTAIDLTIRPQIVDLEDTPCAIIEPLDKQYWLCLNGVIYVFSNYPDSKITAWSTFTPSYHSATVLTLDPTNYDANGVATYSNLTGTYRIETLGNATSIVVDGVVTAAGSYFSGATTVVINGPALAAVTAQLTNVVVTFVPEKFVILNGLVYIRSLDDSLLLRYEREDYDACIATVELPWIDMDQPSQMKQYTAIDAAIAGSWKLNIGTNPLTSTYPKYVDRGSTSNPSMATDSTTVSRRFPINGNGVYIKVVATTNPYARRAKLGKISIVYNKANEK